MAKPNRIILKFKRTDLYDPNLSFIPKISEELQNIFNVNRRKDWESLDEVIVKIVN